MSFNPKEWLVKKILAGALKGAAEGKYGTAPKAIYWWLHDHALWVGFAFSVVDYALVKASAIGVCVQCADIEKALVQCALGLAGLGLLIGFHGADAPEQK